MFDAIKENKVLKAAIVILRLVRIRNCLIAFFGVIVGAVLVAEPGRGVVMPAYVAALTAAIVTGGGNALNDYFDALIDRVNRPDRPIPSRRIQKSDALMLAISLLLVGLGLSKTVNTYCLAIAALNVFILIVYAAYSKRMLFVANLGVSYLVASVFIFGALAELGSPRTDVNAGGILVAAVITACAFFMTLSREIIKDVEDIEGDRKMYSRSIPIVFGARNAKNVSILFAGVAILLSFAPLIYQFPTLNLKAYGIIIGVADISFISALTMFPALSQRIMIVGMILSLTAFLVGKTLA